MNPRLNVTLQNPIPAGDYGLAVCLEEMGAPYPTNGGSAMDSLRVEYFNHTLTVE